MNVWVVLLCLNLAMLVVYGYFVAKVITAPLKRQLQEKQLALQVTQQQLEQLQQETTVLNQQVTSLHEDPITHLISQRLFEDRVIQCIKESDRYHLIFGLLLIDIDNFESIDNGLGRLVSEQLLVDVAKRLVDSLRQVDTVSRLNKDRFVVLLTQLNKPETVAIVVQRILQAMLPPFVIETHEIRITLGIGIVIYPQDGCDLKTLLQHAEQALQQARGKDKHTYHYYEAGLAKHSQSDLFFSQAFKSEAIYSQIELLYQPIVNVVTNQVIALDVYCTCSHPGLALIDSATLYQYAEKNRQLDELTMWLIKQACQQFLIWQAAGATFHCLFIPLTWQQLGSSRFIYDVTQWLQTINYNPAWLVFTLRETGDHGMTSISLDVLERSFNMLNYVGIRLGIEIGPYQSIPLLLLRQPGITYIKLEAPLLGENEFKDRLLLLIKAVQQLMGQLRIQPIVTQIKSAEEEVWLKAMGYQLMTGDYIARPLSAEAVLKQYEQGFLLRE